MYLEYFSLQRHPFRITPDPSLFFPGGTHGRGVVLDALVYGITSGEGILKVVGEVGSGKTMLCRMLEERLPKSVEIVYLANPSLSARDIVYAIAIELGLDVDAATDRLLVMHKLQEYLLRRHGEGGSVVVFIEEAQSMPLETLEEVRLLSNLETHRHKLMQIVLFGQPELDRKLEQKSIRQLRERITHSFQLDPLSVGQIQEYLHFRLQSAGCPWPQLFSTQAEVLLAKASTGLTRRINILADKALLASYADPATRPEPRNGSGEIQPMVLARHVKIAIADSGYKNYGGSQLPFWLGYMAAAVGGALLVALGFWLWNGLGGDQPEPSVAIQAESPVGTVAVATAVETLQSLPSAEPPAATQPATPTVAIMPTTAAIQSVAQVQVSGSASVPTQVSRQAPVGAVELNPPVVVSRADSYQQTQVEVAETGAALIPDTTEAVASLPEPAVEPLVESAVEPIVEPIVEPMVDTVIEPNQDRYAGLPGLTRIRLLASEAWLRTMGERTGYTIQMYSVSTENSEMLEEFLEFLQLADMMDSTYVCLISGNSRRAEQWLVLHGEYPGLSATRDFIGSLPPYVLQHSPYARNMSGIACANETFSY